MILIRHGQSEFNVVYAATRVDPGIPDPRLTEEGRQQAAAIAADLRGQPLQRLISSPYTRALETAEIIAAELGLDIVVEPLVRERAAFHCDIGASPSELKRRFPRLRFDHLADPWWHDHVARGIAESEAALIERCLLFRRAMAAAPDWRQIAVVTHWGFIRAMTGRPVTNGERVAVDLSPAEATARQG
jgi:broad specificity phosphatase PhoE